MSNVLREDKHQIYVYTEELPFEEAEENNKLKAKERGSREANPANILTSSFQSPEPWENKFMLFRPPILWYFATATLENEYH